jgi:hypothetical protein
MIYAFPKQNIQNADSISRRHAQFVSGDQNVLRVLADWQMGRDNQTAMTNLNIL